MGFPGEGNGKPFQYSCLGNPRTEEPGRLREFFLQLWSLNHLYQQYLIREVLPEYPILLSHSSFPAIAFPILFLLLAFIASKHFIYTLNQWIKAGTLFFTSVSTHSIISVTIRFC